MINVGIVSLNYFSDKKTICLINSLIDLEGLGDKFKINIAIIDNGSADQYLLNYLKKKYQSKATNNVFSPNLFLSIQYFFPGSNLGFSVGCNKGHELLKLEKPDFLFFVNNDAILAKNCLLELIDNHNENMVKDRILSPNILTTNGKSTWFDGGIYNSILGYSSHVPYAVFKRKENKYLSGCALFMPTEIFLGLGGFNESFFIYGEDLDLSIRASKQGILLDVCKSAIAYHDGGGSIGKKTRKAYFHYVSGSLGVFLSNRPLIFWPLFVGRHLLKLTALIVLFRIDKDSAAGYLKGMLNAFSQHVNRK
jgi:GT2 family glycosyltransferase